MAGKISPLESFVTRRACLAASAALMLFTALGAAAAESAPHPGLDAYARVLAQAVRFNSGRTASEVDYAWLAAHREDLRAVLEAFSGVSADDFDGWTRDRRLAFLINAYNAFTLELILTRYPDLASIKDLGSLFRSPWKKRFFVLLGAERSLDELEHEMIRQQFAEPRIHAAVNCASCGCPALLDEPFRASKLDQQLTDAMGSFLAHRPRNRFEAGSGRLWLSPIFDWYEEDFVAASGSVLAYVSQWSEQLQLPPESERRGLKVDFTRYDWRLNDLERCAP